MPDCSACAGTGRATRMPLCDDPWNEVVPGLFMGGHDVRAQSPSACVVTDEFDLVVSLTAREGYGPSRVEHVVVRLADAVLDPTNAARVRELGALVAAAVRDGRRMLVRCSGGLNRSGVVVAEALVQLGHTPDEAVRAVRAARGPWALTNPGFVSYLSRGYDGALLSRFEPPSRLGLERWFETRGEIHAHLHRWWHGRDRDQADPAAGRARPSSDGDDDEPGEGSGLGTLGAHAVTVNGLDSAAVGESVATAEPDAVVHQMSSLAGKLDPKHFDRSFAMTNRLRTEGLDNLVAAAQATGVQHIVAQSYTGWPNIRSGGWVKDEEDPLDPDPPKAQRESLAAIRYLEEAVQKADGTVLRYGGFYGDASDAMIPLVRKRQFPIVGGGPGYTSWVHLDDAASATVLALELGARGVFNIVDDEPAPGIGVVAVPRRVRGGEAAPAAAGLGGSARSRRCRRLDAHPDARLVQRTCEA